MPMKSTPSCQSRWVIAGLRKRILDDAGNAALEFALAFSIFGTPMLLGAAEVATLVYSSIEVSNCAHSGAMYGMRSSTFAADSGGIETAAQSEAGDFGSGINVSSSTYYACSSAIDGTQYSTQSAANSACPANASNHYLQFVKVVASVTLAPPAQVPGLPKTWPISSQSVMEVQE